MRRLVCLFVASFFLCAAAAAQPEGVSGIWKHYFLEQSRTVYLELGKRTLIVWSVGDDGSCMQYPGGAQWNGDHMRRMGQDWRLRVDASALQVAFPDTTLTYERSAEDPRELCQREDI